ncbi:hypothetical protein [Mycobacteroides abscessus]|uniref:C2H2-type domain-containing protein n=1 Tax=Mycobacteroides abscessus TaxID=36809 RepID=A0A0U0ZPK6_9MYCO|nr:hypothetical protein [Mycobacteroides abscessus]WJJ55954.1 hypothetical protein PROPHIT491_17 [Mycobacterium phage prophiT49-1]SKS43795.1 Uncharacterised protein [Mycobacteroides abscessus subsp. abscessus]MBL3737084.1 hypothetical protein [Mycobacteroides abscessus subsp. massiliense]MBL3744225.1 hypothetical protein [Mycobacteroides abscessus subsp. massiliense]MBL3761361.1 hypothetical protein [Mycobacteroides abscessus subsp. massiliense]
MSATFTAVDTYTVIHCVREGCGVPYALNDEFVRQRRKDHKSWHCPNGHSQYYPQKNETEEAKARAAMLERQLANWEEDLRAAKAAHAVTKGKLTKTRNRVAKGVCPCCNRSFANLQRHMAGQHPGFTDAKQ